MKFSKCRICSYIGIYNDIQNAKYNGIRTDLSKYQEFISTDVQGRKIHFRCQVSFKDEVLRVSYPRSRHFYNKKSVSSAVGINVYHTLQINSDQGIIFNLCYYSTPTKLSISIYLSIYKYVTLFSRFSGTKIFFLLFEIPLFYKKHLLSHILSL